MTVAGGNLLKAYWHSSRGDLTGICIRSNPIVFFEYLNIQSDITH